MASELHPPRQGEEGSLHVVIEQDENFKFGGPKLYHSTQAVVCWLCIRGRWFALKVSAVKTRVPLLVSRPALAALGMTYRMDTNEADFAALGLHGIKLGFTTSGHPKMEALDFTGVGGDNHWPDRVDWSVTEVFVPAQAGIQEQGPQNREVYMVRDGSASGGHGVGRLFYEKVDDATRELMTRQDLPHESFLNWWRSHDTHRDFWVETENYMDRIHVVPRRHMFNPTAWNTNNQSLKQRLLSCLHESCETTCISCTAVCMPMVFNHNWKNSKLEHVNYVWIGRSRFKRRTATSNPIREVIPEKIPYANVHGEDAMEDEQGRDRGCAAGDEGSLQEGVDIARVEGHVDRGAGGSRTWQAQVAGPVVYEVGDPVATGQLYQGNPDEAPPGQCPTDTRGGGELRPLQGVQVQGGARGLPGVGDGGGCREQEPQLGSGPVGKVGTGQGFDRRVVGGLCGSGGCGGGTTSTESRPESGSKAYPGGEEGDPQDHGGEQEHAHEQDSADLRCGGTELVGGGPIHGRGDQGLGGSPCSDEDSEGGREEEGRGHQEQEEVIDVGTGRSKTSRKKREYWARIKALKMARRQRKLELGEASDEEIEDYEADLDKDAQHEVFYVDVDDFEETADVKYPKVNLKYPQDYEQLRRLPHRKVKRTTKKRVQCMAKKVLTCLMTQVVAMATPVAQEFKEAVADPVRDFWWAATGHRHSDKPVLLELFAGSAHMTTEFARRGYNVLEPRDIVYGHDLFDEYQQESVIHDIRTFKPRLLWVALPCTAWSPWQRLNFAQRMRQLRKMRRIQKKLVRFAIRCVEVQLGNGGEVIMEHPRDSDMWKDEDMEEILHDDWWTRVDVDMCRYNLRALSDNGLLKKPTRLMVSDERMATVLKKNCRGDHNHTPTAGRNTKAAGVYTKEFCATVVRAFRRLDGLWAAEGEMNWEAFAASAESKPLEVREEEVGGASGIYLPENVPKHITKALRRIHQNLGHPSNRDLARHLRLSGAAEEASRRQNRYTVRLARD